MRRAIRLAISCVFSMAACASSKEAKPEQQAVAQVSQQLVDASEALALIERFECARCHQLRGVAEVARDKHCVRCHREIQDGSYQGDPELIARWSANIHSLQVTPSLDSLGAKLRHRWVRDQLLHPRDVRPALEASMPRLALSEKEANILADYLVPAEREEENFDEASLARGAQLFETLNCDACHALGAHQAKPRAITLVQGAEQPTRDALLLAPDLALTRERFQSGALVAWLMDPQALQPDTLMPNFHLKESEARSLAAYIWKVKFTATPMATLGERLPLLAREVGWDEVFSKVFKTVCWHCHSSKEFAMGDGGPGNTGGFGFAARGLDLSSYEAILSGSFGPDGRRRSVFTKDEEGVPLLIRSMLVRQDEERGLQGPILGMPLGFPSMSREQIQLVESWLAQGRPR